MDHCLVPFPIYPTNLFEHLGQVQRQTLRHMSEPTVLILHGSSGSSEPLIAEAKRVGDSPKIYRSLAPKI